MKGHSLIGKEVIIMALPVQVQYWEYLEGKRHNLAQEYTANRQAAAAEEQARAATKNAETNYLNYDVNKTNAESNRMQALAAQENARINAENARINAYNAETNRLNYQVNLQNAESNYKNALTNERNAETNRYNADTNRYIASYQEVLGYGNLQVAKDNAQSQRIDVLGKQDVYSSQVQSNKATAEKMKADTAYTKIETDYYPTVVKTNTATSWINTVVNAVTKTGGLAVDMKRAFAPVRAK